MGRDSGAAAGNLGEAVTGGRLIDSDRNVRTLPIDGSSQVAGNRRDRALCRGRSKARVVGPLRRLQREPPFIMNSFEANKIFGALLGTVFVLFGGSLLAEGIFHAEAPEQPGFAIAVPDAPAGGGAAPAANEVTPVGQLMQTANAEAGAAIFKRCQACHSGEKGGPNKVGPDLWDVVNRPIASHEGFSYSAAITEFSQGKSVGLGLGSPEPLPAWPKQYIKGTAMGFAGIRRTRSAPTSSPISARCRTTRRPPPRRTPARRPAAKRPRKSSGSGRDRAERDDQRQRPAERRGDAAPGRRHHRPDHRRRADRSGVRHGPGHRHQRREPSCRRARAADRARPGRAFAARHAGPAGEPGAFDASRHGTGAPAAAPAAPAPAAPAAPRQPRGPCPGRARPGRERRSCAGAGPVRPSETATLRESRAARSGFRRSGPGERGRISGQGRGEAYTFVTTAFRRGRPQSSGGVRASGARAAPALPDGDRFAASLARPVRPDPDRSPGRFRHSVRSGAGPSRPSRSGRRGGAGRDGSGGMAQLVVADPALEIRQRLPAL